MKKLASTIKKLFRVNYRLTVQYRGESKPRNIHGLNGKLLRNMGRNMDVQFWALYKTGPLGLAERKVAGSDWEGGGQ